MLRTNSTPACGFYARAPKFILRCGPARGVPLLLQFKPRRATGARVACPCGDVFVRSHSRLGLRILLSQNGQASGDAA